MRPYPGGLAAGTMSAGQIVTAIVGVGLCLETVHRCGEFVGWLHPRSVSIDPRGRPTVVSSEVPPGWGVPDDVTALLRLGVALAVNHPPLARAMRELASEQPHSLSGVTQWVLGLARPLPLL